MKRLILVAAALVALVAPTPAGWVERVYSRGVYLTLERAVTPFSNRFSFALVDLLLVGACVLVVVGVARAVLSRARASAFGLLALDIAAVLAVAYLAFLALWGLNYRRVPLAGKVDFDRARVNAGALRAFAERSVGEVNRLYSVAHREGWPGLDEDPEILAAGFDAAQRVLGVARGAVPGVPKRSLLDFYFRRAGIDGMTDPFFLEVIVTRDLLPFERPFTLAHEWGHLAGYADESEASFVAWLTCMRGRDAERYSAWLVLSARAVADLPGSERRAIADRLATGPREDLDAVARRLSRVSAPVSSVAWRAYDRFLKTNRVPAGVRSYDEVIALLLGTRFRDGWIPVQP